MPIDPSWATIDADVIALGTEWASAPPDDTAGRIAELRQLERQLLAIASSASKLRLEATVTLPGGASLFGFGPISGGVVGFFTTDGLGVRYPLFERALRFALQAHAAAPALVTRLRQVARGEAVLPVG